MAYDVEDFRRDVIEPSYKIPVLVETWGMHVTVVVPTANVVLIERVVLRQVDNRPFQDLNIIVGSKTTTLLSVGPELIDRHP